MPIKLKIEEDGVIYLPFLINAEPTHLRNINFSTSPVSPHTDNVL